MSAHNICFHGEIKNINIFGSQNTCYQEILYICIFLFLHEKLYCVLIKSALTNRILTTCFASNK